MRVTQLGEGRLRRWIPGVFSPGQKRGGRGIRRGYGLEELVRELGRRGAPPGREDESEGRVVTHLLHHLERLSEVLLGLTREAHDDVRGERAVGYELPDHRHAVEVEIASGTSTTLAGEERLLARVGA